jgi:hypothetical protein
MSMSCLTTLGENNLNVEVAQNSSDLPQYAELGSMSHSSIHSLVLSVASKVVVNLAKARKV